MEPDVKGIDEADRLTAVELKKFTLSTGMIPLSGEGPIEPYYGLGPIAPDPFPTSPPVSRTGPRVSSDQLRAQLPLTMRFTSFPGIEALNQSGAAPDSNPAPPGASSSSSANPCPFVVPPGPWDSPVSSATPTVQPSDSAANDVQFTSFPSIAHLGQSDSTLVSSPSSPTVQPWGSAIDVMAFTSSSGIVPLAQGDGPPDSSSSPPVKLPGSAGAAMEFISSTGIVPLAQGDGPPESISSPKLKLPGSAGDTMVFTSSTGIVPLAQSNGSPETTDSDVASDKTAETRNDPDRADRAKKAADIVAKSVGRVDGLSHNMPQVQEGQRLLDKLTGNIQDPGPSNQAGPSIPQWSASIPENAIPENGTGTAPEAALSGDTLPAEDVAEEPEMEGVTQRPGRRQRLRAKFRGAFERIKKRMRRDKGPGPEGPPEIS
jgi:hypothetical protein